MLMSSSPPVPGPKSNRCTLNVGIRIGTTIESAVATPPIARAPVRGQVGTARGFGSEWPWSSARIGPQRAICSDSERKIIARNPIAVSV